MAIPYRELVFDSTDVAGINDAFELALLDADGVPLIETTGELRDSFYNITEGEDARLAVGAGSEVVDEDTTIYVDISTLTPGAEFQLVARLINNDTDTGTEVAIGEVTFVALNGLPPLDGTEPGPALIVAPAVDVNSLREMGSTAGLLYSVTSANEEQGALVVEAAVVNLTAAPLEGSLIVVVDQLSDPNVQVQNPDGVTSSGQPYFNFSALFPADGLNAGALTPARSLVFLNPDAVPFTYELILLGEPNRDPIWQSSPSTEALVGETFTYTGVATDPDGDTISYSVVAGPTGLGINGTSGALTWTPASPGSYSIVLEASDGRGGAAQQSFTVLATDEIANRPPAFQSRPDVDAALGNDYSYSAQATDPDGDGVTYSLTTKPEGMAVNPATGQVTLSPTLAQRGEHSVVLRVEDGRGGVASQAYRVNVGNDPANNPPAFVTEAPTAFSVGLPGTASGPVSPNALVLDAPPGTTRTEQVSIIAAETGGVTPHVVFIVDESGSMAGEQAWIAEAVLGLDSSLNAQGVFDTKYSMLGFNGFTRFLNAANFEGTVRIVSPEGDIIQTRSFGFPNDQSGPSTFTALPESGEYRVLVEPSTSSVYGIRNTILEGDLSVPITGFNQTYQGTLANGEQIEYLLSAPAGTQIRGSALIRTTAMTLTFVAPSGATFTPQEAMLLPESGEYRVIIRAFDNGSFTYRPFILNGGTPITIGEEVSGTTSSATGMVFYEFEAEAGQELF
ncbi:MAG: putative Ig domain-containing protein, partial [Thiohalocapsa sp.]